MIKLAETSRLKMPAGGPTGSPGVTFSDVAPPPPGSTCWPFPEPKLNIQSPLVQWDYFTFTKRPLCQPDVFYS